MSHSHYNIADNIALRRAIPIILRDKAIKEESEKKAISECKKQILQIINELRIESVLQQHPPLNERVDSYLTAFKTKEKIKKELAEWKKLHFLVQLTNKVKQSPGDVHLSNLLTIYTADVLLTVDASLSQEIMQHRAAILGVIGVIILTIFPMSFSLLALTHGSGLSVGFELAIVMISKIVGIFAFFNAMKVGEGACRQSFSHAETVNAALVNRKDLSLTQNCLLELSKSKVADNKFNIFSANQALLHEAFDGLKMDDKIKGIITKDFEEIIKEVKELTQQAINNTAAADQADWVKLLPYFIRFTEDPFNTNAVNELDQKAKEIWVKAEVRQEQETLKKIAKIMLLASLILTTACIATIVVAMAFYGAAATSGVVAAAHSLMYLSKIMFWCASFPVAKGSDYYQKKQSSGSDKPIDVHPDKFDKLSSLQKISFYSKRIAQKAKKVEVSPHTSDVSKDRTPSMMPSAT